MPSTRLNNFSLRKVGQRSPWLACLLIGLALLTGSAQAQYTHTYDFPTLSEVGFRLTEPNVYDQEYHVKTTGNNDNAGTSDAPLLTIAKALEKAKASLKEGKKTKILIYPGTYVESIKETSWNSNDNTTKETLLCIEGQDADGEVVLQPLSTEYHALWLQGKHSMIIRNLIFDGNYQNNTTNNISEQYGLLQTYTYFFTIDERYEDWLVENCTFKNSNGRGLMLLHNIYSTFRNLTVKDNNGGGASIATKNGLVENITLTNNNISKNSVFGNGGLFWVSANTILRNSNLSGNKGTGLRMDHSCINSVFENLTCDNNTDQGMIFETSPGPVLIKNCKARGNKDAGLELATAYDVVVDGNTFSDNIGTQIKLVLMKRDTPEQCVYPNYNCTGSNYDTAPTDGEDWTNSFNMVSSKRIEILNNTVTTTGISSKLVSTSIYNNQLESSYIETFLTGDYFASNNKYFNPDDENAFKVGSDTFYDLSGWKTRTGEENNSVWGNGGPVPATPTLEGIAVNGANSITLTWTDNSDNETEFLIQRKKGNNGLFYNVASVGNGITTYTNTGLTASTEYYYRVKAINDNGYSEASSVFIASTPVASAGDVVFAVNAGGVLHIASDGTSYESDYNYEGGSTYTWTGEYANTSDDELYGPERYGSNFSYKVPLPKGTYDVTFKWADTKTKVGDRIFNVYAEDFAVLSNLDIYAKAGASYKAYDVTKRITITDDTMKLTFKGTDSPDGSATVKGLLIKKSTCTDCAVMIDSLNDWSKTYSHTDWYLAQDDQASSNFDNDKSRAARHSTATESIVYNYDAIEGFNAVFLYQPLLPVTIKFYTSQDNTTYTEIATEHTDIATGGNWAIWEYTPTVAIPDGTNFLKIEVSGGDYEWTPQLSRVQIQYRSSLETAFSGDYKIIAKHSGKVLDVDQQSQDNGAIVQQYGYNGGNNQQWTLESVGDGYYKIIAKHSGKVLDVNQQSQDNGAIVQQYGYNGGNNQQWTLESVGDGYYKIIAKHSGKVLDVNGVSSENGANVQQWEYTGGDNQKWKLESVNSTARVAVKDEKQARAMVAPNPAVTQTTFHYWATEAGKIQMVITDMAGRVIMNRMYQVAAGENTISLPLQGVQTGLHLVKVVSSGACTAKAAGSSQDLTLKLLIQK